MGGERKRGNARTAAGFLRPGPPLVLFTAHFCTQTEAKCNVKKTRNYLCTFLHIYALFQSGACSFPHPSQDLSPMNEDVWEIRMTLARLCGIGQEGQRRPLWLAYSRLHREGDGESQGSRAAVLEVPVPGERQPWRCQCQCPHAS